jgi:hypothetical protein
MYLGTEQYLGFDIGIRVETQFDQQQHTVSNRIQLTFYSESHLA